MRVLTVRGDMALCEAADGTWHEVAVELVQPVGIGGYVLVHAGVAIG
jgi:hydrogenase maturation factor